MPHTSPRASNASPMAQQQAEAAGAAPEPPALKTAHPNGGLCPEPMTWDELQAAVEENTVESLGKLGRNEDQIKVYRAFMASVRNDYASVADFIKISVFEAAVHFKDGKKHAVDTEHANSERLIWRRNDFPYNFSPGMEHWLLWAAREVPAARIPGLMHERFPPDQYDSMFFVNPPSLQSVLAVWHCHVIVRPKQQEAKEKVAAGEAGAE